MFVDAAAYSHSILNGSRVHVKFIDWVPGICSALGMLVINLIEKSRLSADSYSYNGSGVAWKARLVLFLGFALLAGGVAGSVVSPPWLSCPRFSSNAHGPKTALYVESQIVYLDISSTYT